MKNLIYSLALMVCFGSMFSCNKDKDTHPTLGITPSFSFTPSEDNANEILFENTSKGNYSALSWDFGNLTSSNDEKEDVIYFKKGTYTVSLTLYTNDGDSVTTEQRVKVEEDLQGDVAFSIKISDENPNKIIVENKTKKRVDSLRWDFGNGETSTQPKDTLLYTFYGQYRIKLTAYIGGEPFSYSRRINLLRNGFDIDFSYESVANHPGQLALKNTTNVAVDSLKWDFGNGLFSTQPQDTTRYAFSGDYEVKLTAYFNEGQDYSVTKEVNVSADGITPEFEFVTLNNPNKVAFKNTTDEKSIPHLNYQWDFGNGLTSTQKKDTLLYSKAGDYEVQLTISQGSHAATSTVQTVHIANDYQFVENPNLTQQGAWENVIFDNEAPTDVIRFDPTKGLVFLNTGGINLDRAVYQKIDFPEAGEYTMTGHIEGYRKLNAYYQIYLLPASNDPTNSSVYNSDFELYDPRPQQSNIQKQMEGTFMELKYKGSGDEDGTIEVPEAGAYYLVIRTHNTNWSLTDGSGMAITNVTIKKK